MRVTRLDPTAKHSWQELHVQERIHAPNQALRAFGRNDKHHARHYPKTLTCHEHAFVLLFELSTFTAR